jgi:hypothetical protein
VLPATRISLMASSSSFIFFPSHGSENCNHLPSLHYIWLARNIIPLKIRMSSAVTAKQI